MAYADLTTEEKRQLQDWLRIVRPMFGGFSKVLNDFEVAKIAYDSHVSVVLGLLASGDEVPNESGLPGAIAVTKAELMEALTDANAELTTHNVAAKQQLRVKLCGAAEMLG